MSAQCKSCGAPILWVETVNGKRMPLDERPAGRFAVFVAGGTQKVVEIREAYVSHFATCKFADQHRKPRT